MLEKYGWNIFEDKIETILYLKLSYRIQEKEPQGPESGMYPKDICQLRRAIRDAESERAHWMVFLV